MKKYKLTNQKMQTMKGFQWDLGIEQTTDGLATTLCNNHWLHYYHSPLLAVLFNPIHADIKCPRLFEVQALGNHLDDCGIKGGCTNLTLIEEIELPVISEIQTLAFAILCSIEVWKNEEYLLWANNWLNGTDRTKRSAGGCIGSTDTSYFAKEAVLSSWHTAKFVGYAGQAATLVNNKINLIELAEKAIKYQ